MKRQFHIYEEQMEKLKKKLVRFEKKAKIHNIPFSWKELGTEFETTEDGTFKIFKLEIDAERIELDGWKFIAVIDHLSDGNIVRNITDKALPKEYWTIKGNCQHCHTNRKRKYTIILENENGDLIQVGRSCLSAYTGIEDIHQIAGFYETLEDMILEGPGPARGEVYIHRNSLLNIAYQLVEKEGYRPTSEMNLSTVSQALDHYYYDKEKEDIIEAKKELEPVIEEIVNWIQTNTSDSDYIWNLKRSCSEPFLSPKYTGIAVSSISAYKKHLAYQEKQKMVKKEKAKSNYIGTIKERLETEVLIEKVFFYDTQWGVTFINKMVDQNGNIIVWKTKQGLEEGKKYQIKGTVKEHSEYYSEKQTILTRCKVEKV